MESIDRVLSEIQSLPSDWHGCGTMSPRVLQAMADHISRLGPNIRSLETGSGKTTLLFSHLSPDHTVFALDCAGSISRVRESPLFRADRVTYVEGPTQVTLPQYAFPGPLQVALIDGPHGYPFPDLEYFYLYPHIAPGGLLLLDDTNIPSIGRMHDIIRAGDMFELVEMADDTAFYRRTTAPLIDPHSDSWWLQNYNRAYYDQLMSGSPGGRQGNRFLRAAIRVVPSGVRRLVPERVRQAVSRWI